MLCVTSSNEQTDPAVPLNFCFCSHSAHLSLWIPTSTCSKKNINVFSVGWEIAPAKASHKEASVPCCASISSCFLGPFGQVLLTYLSFPLLPKAATIPELSTRRKSICLPLTRAAHPSLQALARLFIYREDFSWPQVCGGSGPFSAS